MSVMCVKLLSNTVRRVHHYSVGEKIPTECSNCCRVAVPDAGPALQTTLQGSRLALGGLFTGSHLGLGLDRHSGVFDPEDQS